MASLLDRADEFISEALAEARMSLAEGGIPVGSVLVRDGVIIGRGHNRRVQSGDPTAHAEIECLRNAGRQSSYKGTILYSTLMPCHLCAGAIVQFGIEYVVAGEATNFTGAQHFMKDHWVQFDTIDDEACERILRDFIAAHPNVWKEDIGA
ncbi:MAG: nucleoside deaminase [Bacteroidetes bacterium]|jgi:cytosine deaminase|nr:nucleoside deaminase [Bacteroidota bacterium]